MKFWNLAPMFRLLLPFSAGIIASIFTDYDYKGKWIVGLCLFMLLIYVLLRRKIYLSYRYKILFGILTDICLFYFAYIFTQLRTESHSPSHFSHHYQKAELMLVKVAERPVEKLKTYKLTVEALKLKDSVDWHDVSGHALLYIQKNASTSAIEYGDVLIIRPQLKKVEGPHNPGEFNYRRYLRFHQIEWQSYLPAGKCLITGINLGNPIYRWAQKLRMRCLQIFNVHGLSGDQFAVASALILGYKDALGERIKHSYASAGAMHVLAVSGLHVGIIFLVLKNMLLFLEKIRYGLAIKTIIMLCGLWFYAALTGFSPSVLRATTMFSFILIGKALNRSAVIYNTLATSAFVLLLFNPFLLMEVGFQLSYLAVTGIVFMQPRLYHLWRPKFWLTDKIWAITCVSVAAQIATFPLGILYFHQFPNYFLFSNLIVIPMAAVILYNGIIIFSLATFPGLCNFGCEILSIFVRFLNKAVAWIESLPHAITAGLTINIMETYLIYAIIILLLSFMVLAKPAYIRYALIGCILFVSMQITESYRERNQKSLIVYDVPGERAYDFICGHHDTFIADRDLIDDDSKMLFRIKHNWWETGIEEQRIIPLVDHKLLRENDLWFKYPYLQFHHVKCIFVDSQYKHKTVNRLVDVDYVILSENAKISLSTLTKQFRCKLFIIDSSNSSYSTTKWMKEAQNLHIPAWNVREKGAFVVHFNT